MIEISNNSVFELCQLTIKKDISCSFKFAKKARKYFTQYLENCKIQELCDVAIPEKFYISDISSYLSSFLISDEKYKITDVKYKENKKIIILPYFERISENVYSVFAMDYTEKPSLIIKYKETYINLIEERCLYLSHVLKYKGKEYGVLSMSNLFTIENVQRSYNLVRKYMEMCNTLSSRENRMICKDWLYQEISTYIFQIQLLSAESIFAHLNKYKVEEEVFNTCKEKEFKKVVKSFFVEIK
jgi:hypothetical protein